MYYYRCAALCIYYLLLLFLFYLFNFLFLNTMKRCHKLSQLLTKVPFPVNKQNTQVNFLLRNFDNIPSQTLRNLFFLVINKH